VRAVRVSVPGSTANLGPGFDVLAAALGRHLEIEVEETGRFSVQTELTLRRDRENLVVRAFEYVHPADGFEFRINSTIPLNGGFGSSAAGIVAGLIAAKALFVADVDTLALATEIEGHPDNVAASLHGGFVICDGTSVERIDPPAGLEAVMVVPARAVRTAQAREALPLQVPLGDAVRNVASVSKLVLGLARGDLELIAAGLGDVLHQPYRAHLYPRSAELVERATEIGALGATISGAGPTVLVWVRTADAERLTRLLTADAEGWAEVLRVPFESVGARVLPDLAEPSAVAN
jgi:homoserine kinase